MSLSGLGSRSWRNGLGTATRLVALWTVITSQQSIVAVCPCINLMQAASLSATRTAFTAAEVFEMQNKDSQILGIASELVLRLSAPAHAHYGITNFCGQPVDVLRIQSRVQKMQAAAASERG